MKLGILDNRAAVQEKLGAEYHISALKDARRMMSLQRASPKGYLRAGKILQLMGKYDIAAENYEYGLRQLEPADVDGKRVGFAKFRRGAVLMASTVAGGDVAEGDFATGAGQAGGGWGACGRSASRPAHRAGRHDF